VRSAWLRRLEVLSVDPAGNADIFRRMFVQDDVDNLRIGPDRVVRDLDDVPKELFTTLKRQTCLDVAFDKRHDISPGIPI